MKKSYKSFVYSKKPISPVLWLAFFVSLVLISLYVVKLINQASTYNLNSEAALGKNILANPSFETQNSLVGWNVDRGDGSTVVSSPDYNTLGKRSLKMVNTKDNVTSRVSQTVDVKPNTTYTFSAKGLHLSTGGVARIIVTEYDKRGEDRKTFLDSIIRLKYDYQAPADTPAVAAGTPTPTAVPLSFKELSRTFKTNRMTAMAEGTTKFSLVGPVYASEGGSCGSLCTYLGPTVNPDDGMPQNDVRNYDCPIRNSPSTWGCIYNNEYKYMCWNNDDCTGMYTPPPDQKPWKKYITVRIELERIGTAYFDQVGLRVGQ